ncbi:ZIP metal ion transporter family [Actinidia rufa]|uniref:ZIP metal ion transporter family n=1 Tax=Actinidia rufa TaxID=165716 RepID=A0A7J0HCH3_9ERIC|nr:ZIP metal ion transporter family [Actinidia rufa]
MLGLLQGFAAGLMLSISFLNLAHNAINSIGFLKGNLWFFAGVLFFAIVVNFIPEPSVSPISDEKSKKKNGDEGGKDIMKKHRRQVLFSGIITAVVIGNFTSFHLVGLNECIYDFGRLDLMTLKHRNVRTTR